jgi:DNA-binding protein H-NS
MTKTTTTARVRHNNLYTIELDGKPVAQALAISQAEAVRLYVESVQQPVISARMSPPIEARTLAGLPLLTRGDHAPAPAPDRDPRVPDMFDDEPADPVLDGLSAGMPDHVEVVLAMVPPQHAPIAAVVEGLPADFIDYIEGEGGAAAAQMGSPPADRMQTLLDDAYRLGLNDAGIPGQIVGERAYAMQQGLYITDADAVSAAFSRGCSDAWKLRQEAAAAPQGEPAPSAPSTAEPMVSHAPVDVEQQVQAVLDRRVQINASGQAGEDAENIRSELKRQAEAAAARRAMAGKPVAMYLNPANGSTWSGRGLKPRWLVDAIEAGRTQDEFLIDTQGARA